MSRERASTPPKPVETQTTMALRSHVAALLLYHAQLDDTALFHMLVTLRSLAAELGCSYHLGRQLSCSLRGDEALVARLQRLPLYIGGVRQLEDAQRATPAGAKHGKPAHTDALAAFLDSKSVESDPPTVGLKPPG